MTGIIVVQVNCASEAEAHRIAGEAVARRLAASANIHGPIASVYRWQGAVETAAEVPLVLKTRAGLFDDLASLIARLHSYETPCIVGIDADRVHRPYADWVAAATTPDNSDA